ncbi:MAG: Efflux ABC transporter, ATP-binding protein, partial [uncultured Solirubrobacteraceae bacterium]
VRAGDRGARTAQVLRRGACRLRCRPRCAGRHGARPPRSQRSRQDDDGAHPHHAARPRRGPGARGRPRRGRRRRGSALAHRAGRPVRGGRREPDRPGEPRDGGAPVPPRSRQVAPARRRAAGDLRAHRRRQAHDQDLLGRHAPPPRPRRRAGRAAAGPLPRRADHRPGPAQPAGAVGDHRGSRGGRHDGAADHPVPRRGRPALGPHRGDRPWRGDRRGHRRPAQGPRRGRAPGGQARGGRRRRGGRRDAGGAVGRGAGHRGRDDPRPPAPAPRGDRRGGPAARRAGRRRRGRLHPPADARRRLHLAHRPQRRGGRGRRRRRAGAGGGM